MNITATRVLVSPVQCVPEVHCVQLGGRCRSVVPCKNIASALCLCVCVRACVRVCVRACVRACMRVCVCFSRCLVSLSLSVCLSLSLSHTHHTHAQRETGGGLFFMVMLCVLCP